MEKALKIAIENGYANSFQEQMKPNSAHLLDPLFWQALGRGLNWDESRKWGERRNQLITAWEWKWHRFIDHLASGGDIDSFFNELIK